MIILNMKKSRHLGKIIYFVVIIIILGIVTIYFSLNLHVWKLKLRKAEYTKNIKQTEYLMLKKTERFSQQHLLSSIEYLSQADRGIKSGGTNKKLILEELLIRICRRSKPVSESDADMTALARKTQVR